MLSIFQVRLFRTDDFVTGFNLAALTHGHIIITDEDLQKRYDDYGKTIIKSEANLMGVLATEAAYREGHEWLEALKNVITDNYHYAKEALQTAFPEIEVAPLQGTYLMFVDLNAVLKGMNTTEFMQKKCGVAIDYGEWFGANYHGYIRINLATKPNFVEQTVEAIVREARLRQ